MDMLTLPALSLKSGVGLDRLRRTVQQNPELRAMGRQIGASRAFTLDECAAIVAAAKESKGRRKVQS